MKKTLLTTLLFSIILRSGICSDPIIPTKDGDVYTLKFANLEFQVDAAWGAKIASFKIDDKEFLFPATPGENIYYAGSVVWASPQSEMGFSENKEDKKWYPTIANIDRGQYTGAIKDNMMTFVSEVDEDKSSANIQVIKSFWANPNDSTINIKYSIVNKGDAAISKAVWEVTRVPSEGLFYFPKGEGEPWGKEANEEDLSGDLELKLETYWYKYDAEKDYSRKKFFSDGGDGWMGYVNDANHLFIKSYTDVPLDQIAPEEGEILYWLNDNDTYIELENQSAYAKVGVNDSIHYELKWYLRNLPTDLTAEVGSQNLIDYTNWVMTEKEPEDPIGINESYAQATKVYPNPARTNLYIILPQEVQSASIHIYDMAGKLTLSSTLENNTSINIELLKAGVYFYSIESKDMLVNGKLLKQ